MWWINMLTLYTIVPLIPLFVLLTNWLLTTQIDWEEYDENDTEPDTNFEIICKDNKTKQLIIKTINIKGE